MLIRGSISSKKTDILIEEYVKLLNKGVKSSEILVLLQNSSLKQNFTEKVLEKLNIDCVEKLQVYSFFGLVYNTIIDNWAYIENQIPDNNAAIMPNLVGLEVSQFILKDILKDIKFEGYNSKKSLLHQLFRRYSLVIQNDLNEKDVDWRSKEVLKEGFGEDAKKALKTLLSKTLNYRSFDYLRQGPIFNNIYKKTDAFKNIKYLFIDDADEITPICFNFIEFIAPQLKDAFIAYDEKGSSRSGYLSADKNVFEKLERLFNTQPLQLQPETKLGRDAEILFSNVINKKNDKLKYFTLISPSKRASMIDIAAQKIKLLIKSGVKPSDISVITPVIDDMLKFSLKEQIRPNLATILFLSGSEKLVQNPYVKAALTVLKMDSELKEELTEFDLRVILSDFLKIPLRRCKEILDEFTMSKTLIPFEFGVVEYTEKYNKLRELLNSLNDSKMLLSEQVLMIYKVLADFSAADKNEINKFGFFVKQLQDFESVFSLEVLNSKKCDIIIQIENSIIAENPYSTMVIETNNLVIATPQKIIDNQVRTKYQFWLDVSSSEWIKCDTGPLYNAWVFQADWEKENYTICDDIELGTRKTAAVLRKLVLCADEGIYAYSSLFDGSGVENFGGIEEYFAVERASQTSDSKKITPRDDQKPVLAYKSGNMAISAVPGAGKTTILLALILKLLNDGITPENIYVLTYMESAARNFRERIKNVNQETVQLPNISTIHGLALKILKDNSNFERLGLASDFEICDDSQRMNIIQGVSQKLKLKKTETDDFDRAVSIFKLGGGLVSQTMEDAKVKKFLSFFDEYQNALKLNNLIDYDDMLLSSVKLLEENQDILEFYQENCEYIIEDEAQDSSAIQQRLINLLSAKHKNLIRCGDINQAITTTFSNADVEGFRKFINDNQNKVEMDCSQRCTEGVWKLANALVEFAENKSEYKNAFYKIFMKPVDNRNPVSKNAVKSVVFENTLAEKNYILKQIKEILTKEQKATIGILLRNNYQVANWLSFINDAGFKSISRSECLEQKGVFKVIYAVMNMVLTPFDNKVIASSYEVLADAGFYPTRLQVEISNLAKPFIQTSVDDIQNPYLVQFYWDLVYWLNFSALPAEELAVKIGLHYYTSDIEKSNVYLISTLIKRINNGKSYDFVMKRLGELSKKTSLSGFKFFSEEDESDKEFLQGKIQIMTYHKSKGDEFDYVFLPEMNEKNLTIDFSQMSLKSSSEFTENIRALNPNYVKKDEFEMKKVQIAENLRLLYVAITRAKKSLTFTVATTTKSFGKEIKQEPSIIFSEILEGGNV